MHHISEQRFHLRIIDFKYFIIYFYAVAICPAAGQIAFETFFCYLSGRRTNSLKWSEMLFVRLLINKI